MLKFNLAFILSIFISTVSFGQMSGAQSRFGTSGPEESATPKVKSYNRGGHATSAGSDASGLEELKAIAAKTDTINGQAVGEVIVRKAQKSNANDTTYRVALLIGNSSYQNDKVNTAVNDVSSLSTSLQNAGFEVTELRNGPQNMMMTEIAKFILKSKRARFSIFYFAGHAINLNGNNYLVPVGVEPTNESQLHYMTYNLTTLIKSVKKTDTDVRKDREVLFLIDASRTNSFYASLKIKHQKSVASIGAPHGVLVLQSSVSGYNAVTVENASLFAQVLSKEFMISQTVGAICANTAKEVFRLSNKLQLPMITGHDQHVKLIN